MVARSDPKGMNDRNPLVYGGVFGIVLGAVLAFGIFLDVGDSEAQSEPQAEESVVDRYMDRPAVNIEALKDPTIFMDEVVIEATLPSHLATKVQKPKVWVCGAMKENLVGGSNRDCHWE